MAGLVWHRGRSSARLLRDRDTDDALAVCAADPIGSVLAASRIATGSAASLGAEIWGWPNEGPLEAICWSGANLVPVVPPALPEDRRLAALTAFSDRARLSGQRSSSIVGPAPLVLRMWHELGRYWTAREVRAEQPSLMIDGDSSVAPDPHVRLATGADFDVVRDACAEMFTEEVGYSPLDFGGGASHAARVRELISSGYSFVRTDRLPDGQPRVMFKAEVGAVFGNVAQIQGVWVHPQLRGGGLSAPGMAAVVREVRATIAPVVSLYVNSYNHRALALYRRVGFQKVGSYATVLL